MLCRACSTLRSSVPSERHTKMQVLQKKLLIKTYWLCTLQATTKGAGRPSKFFAQKKNVSGIVRFCARGRELGRLPAAVARYMHPLMQANYVDIEVCFGRNLVSMGWHVGKRGLSRARMND